MSKLENFTNNFYFENGLWVNKTSQNLVDISCNIIKDHTFVMYDSHFLPLMNIHNEKLKNNSNYILESLTPQEFSICRQCFL